MYAQQTAQELGLVGWVENISDGTVEIAAEGEEEKLKKLLTWSQTGPKQAQVDKVEEKWENISSLSFTNFDIRY